MLSRVSRSRQRSECRDILRSMVLNSLLDKAAMRLVTELRSRRMQAVFAESCTGGLVASTLARIPGVSDCFCGSLVSYSNEAKVIWLGVMQQSLRTESSVSEQVAGEMAIGALDRTPAADIAVAVTGYLGPSAPHAMDGLVMVATLLRVGMSPLPRVEKIHLQSSARIERQSEAALGVLQIARKSVCDSSSKVN